MLLHVTMTTRLIIWRFFDRPDSSPWRICPSHAMFRLFARILISDWVVLICCPRRSVPVIRCSIFLRGSWFTIGSSWFFVLEDLSQWFNVPSFCKDLDFRLGRPDWSSQRICPSDSMFRTFAKILISDWVVLILKRDSASCSVTIRSSDVPLCVQLQTTTVYF